MNEILCVHKWGVQIAVQMEYPIPQNTRPYRICGRCKEVWYEADSEPETVVGRLR